jgi:hypothetical protein
MSEIVNQEIDQTSHLARVGQKLEYLAAVACSTLAIGMAIETNADAAVIHRTPRQALLAKITARPIIKQAIERV